MAIYLIFIFFYSKILVCYCQFGMPDIGSIAAGIAVGQAMGGGGGGGGIPPGVDIGKLASQYGGGASGGGAAIPPEFGGSGGIPGMPGLSGIAGIPGLAKIPSALLPAGIPSGSIPSGGIPPEAIQMYKDAQHVKSPYLPPGYAGGKLTPDQMKQLQVQVPDANIDFVQAPSPEQKESAYGRLTWKNETTTTLHPWLRPTTTVVWLRSMPDFISTHDYCDYVAVLCLKAHKTGRICAKTVYYIYQTFLNYCNLEYVNCMEGSDVWNISHMGDCYELKNIGREYMHYGYIDDFHLDQYYVLDDW